MALFIKFNQFIQGLGDGVHNLNTDTIAIYLSNTAPNAATAQVKADVPEIATGNGYAGPIDVHNSYSQAGGVGSLIGDPSVTVTASGGPVGPFRYAILCDTTVLGSPLIAYYDYGASLTLLDTNTFTINFDPTILTLQ